MIQAPLFWLTLAVAVPVFWLLPRPYRFPFLTLVSIGYLATLAPYSVASLLVWTIVFYVAAPLARRNGTRSHWVLPVLVLSILSYLAFFKYIPPIVSALSFPAHEQRVVVPLGISYFTFKFIHYAIEVTRGNIVDRSLPQFFSYIFLFPIFTAGPIERFDHYLANQDHVWTLDSTVAGLTRIVHGIIKRFFLVAAVIEPMFQSLSTSEALLARLEVLPAYKVWAYLVLTYLYVYLDFSAYSDLAIGTSRLFGIRIQENFNWPIFAQNISGFWKRWHMTLSGWCQAYVYMPMIGLTRNPYLAAYATLLAIGLWHSGTTTRVCWGLYHGTGVALYTTMDTI